MRFISKEIRANPDTFGAELHVTIAIPLEYVMDTKALKGIEEVENKIAADFIQLLKNNVNGVA